MFLFCLHEEEGIIVEAMWKPSRRRVLYYTIDEFPSVQGLQIIEIRFVYASRFFHAFLYPVLFFALKGLIMCI